MRNGLPPEWVRQAGVLLTWPGPDGDFAAQFDEVEHCFVEIAAAISRFESVLVCGPVTSDSEILNRIRAYGGKSERVSFWPVPANDVWARDHGPITVFRDQARVHLDFQFNGWGGKFESDLDNQITTELARLGALSATVESLDFVLEGGAIELDGLGSLLTTERCLLAPTRNPGLNRGQIEAKLCKLLGVEQVLWLKNGDLLGDDTDGHIDTLARFCNENTIAYQCCDDPNDPHFKPLMAMAEELREMKNLKGQAYELVPLPLPTAVYDENGQRLPAGYANFLIINGAVLAPVYGVPEDTLALQILAECFPDRRILGINCSPLIRQFGSLHCVTMQLPAAQP